MASHSISRQDIWDFFYDLFEGNEYATAGACGNMQHESGLYSDNAEQKWNDKTGYTDEWLTEGINNNLESDPSYVISFAEFTQPSWNVNRYGFGYGLSQWTTSDRKLKLWEFTIDIGQDIDTVGSQLDYITWEFTEGKWAGTRLEMMQCTSVLEATKIYCDKYEVGAWSDDRLTYANQFYDDFAGSATGFITHITIQGNGEATASPIRANTGETVSLSAIAGAGDYFLVWTVDAGGITLSSTTSTTPTFVMGTAKVYLTAHFTGTTPEPPPYPPHPPEPVLHNYVPKRMPIWMYPSLRA